MVSCLTSEGEYETLVMRLSISSRFFRLGSFIRFRSSLLSPARRPCLHLARRIDFRSVSQEQPILGAIETIVSHCDPCSASCSKTIRTARSRTSGEYLFLFLHDSILSQNGASGNPGAVHFQGSSCSSVRIKASAGFHTNRIVT